MRNLKTFLIATTAIVALSSCSKDNNTPQPGKPNPGQEEKPTPRLQGNGKKVSGLPYDTPPLSCGYVCQSTGGSFFLPYLRKGKRRSLHS